MANTLLQNVYLDDVLGRSPGNGVGNGTGQVLRHQSYPIPRDPAGDYSETNGSGVGAAGAAVSAVLAAVSGKVNYLRGFTVTADAVAVAVTGVTVTVTGLASGGTLSFRFQPVAGQASVIGKEFPRPLAASGANQAITVSVPAIAGGPVVAVEAHGEVGI